LGFLASSFDGFCCITFFTFLTIELLRGFPDLRDLYVESWVALRVDRRVEQ